MKKASSLFIALLLALALCVSCTPTVTDPLPSTPELGTRLNGIDVEDYSIVYSESEPDYNKRAAEYIQKSIKEITQIELSVSTDSEAPAAHEIIVGETNRVLSSKLDADTQGLEFAILADATGIAMEGDYFVIAAAAYYFVDTYIVGEKFESAVPTSVTLATPIAQAPNNFIFLIGDGMGEWQTKLFDYLETPDGAVSDGEDMFYGYMLPYIGTVRTDSLDGTTDSAASGTALATGYKTHNGYIGRDKNKRDVLSLTELADAYYMATSVISTEVITGATPAAFSAHADSRNDTAAISESQKLLGSTIMKTMANSYDDTENYRIISEVLTELSSNEYGFFMMYEEAYIDKSCHNNDLDAAYMALLRFNQAIGQFMEFAFYNPNTLLIITADHETGALRPNADGELEYNSANHSNADVLIFAYGVGAEVFNGKVIENVQIPKTVAKMWGHQSFGDASSPYKAL